MTTQAARLSKSRFVTGCQCHKLLWWTVHEPDAVELQPDKVLQDLFDQGRQVGEVARTRYPGGVLIDLPHHAGAERVAATQQALDAGAPAIFEATFIADNTFVAIDVLEKQGDGYRLTEVKSSTSQKDEHIPDVAVQARVAAACGVKITAAGVLHLNKEFRHPDSGDLFARTDVTGPVAAFLPSVPDEIARQLEPFGGRLGFLDFETIIRAIPVWPGMAPWQQAAAQFSYHERQPDGHYTHAAFLAEGPDDARPKLAAAMVRATAHADRVVMYTSFEKTRIRELQRAVPELAGELAALEAKLLDLHPVVKNCVYHPNFLGSFSLKDILTPLVPELTYDDLVIVDGRVASVEIARLLFVADKIPRHERDRVRRDLLNYCERDTWAMVKLVERLQELAAAAR